MAHKTGYKRKPQAVGDILQRILKKQHIPFHFEDNALRRLWDRSVGPQVASQTSPVHIKKGVLHVKVANSIWMHQLQFLKEDIIKKLNERMENHPIEALQFSLGELPRSAEDVKKRDPAPLALEPLHDRDRQTIQESLLSIRDPELRSVMERVMTNEIGRRRYLQKKRGR